MNRHDSIIFFLIFSSVFPAKLSFLTVVLQASMVLLLLVESTLSKERLFLIFLFFTLLFLQSFANQYIDFKIFVFFIACTMLSIRAGPNWSKVSKYIKLALWFVFIIALTQEFLPFNYIWKYIAENNGHLQLYLKGYSVFSTIGNSTHSAYIVLVLSAYLISVKEFNYITFFVAATSLYMFSNKVSILIFFLLSAFYIFNYKMRFHYKAILACLFAVAALIVWDFLLRSYYVEWTSTELSNIHTINHRLTLFEELYHNLKSIDFWFSGKPRFINDFGLAFDSGVTFLIFRYGLIGAALIYLTVFLTLKRNVSFFVALTFPSVSMIAFYNSQFIIPLFFMSLALFNMKKESTFEKR